MYEESTKYVIETNDEEIAKASIDAIPMKIAIDRYHSEIIRPILKYRDLTADQYEIVEEISDKLREHFWEFLE